MFKQIRVYIGAFLPQQAYYVFTRIFGNLSFI